MEKRFKLYQGDNFESLKKMPDNSVDSVVTDPPYGLSFMNKKWDYDVPSVEFWKEVYRVLKPGGHILSFGGTRTYHRMVVNIEDAGFEIRDQIMWLYGSGFPKSHNIGKAVDKTITKGTSDWEGWGTALKPANEPICLARKPLSEKSIAKNVLKWGTGGINIDECRVESNGEKTGRKVYQTQSWKNSSTKGVGSVTDDWKLGRFPANIILECICDDKGDIHTNPNCPCYMLDEQSGFLKGDSPNRKPRKGGHRKEYVGTDDNEVKNHIIVDKIFDSGGASRFFYQAKVSKKERNLALDDFDDNMTKGSIGLRTIGGTPLYEKGNSDMINKRVAKNNHPTVKPINLMTYLCRLVTPENGIVLDPFMGSGSTGISALLEGFRFVGMEMDEDYIKIAEARIDNYEKYRELLKNMKR